MKACYPPLLGSEERLIFAHNWIFKAAGKKPHGDSHYSPRVPLLLSFWEHLRKMGWGEVGYWRLWGGAVRVASELCQILPGQQRSKVTLPSTWADDLSFLSVFLVLPQAVEMSQTRCDRCGERSDLRWGGKHNTTQHNGNKTKQKHLRMDRSNFPESGSMYFLVTILTPSLSRFAIHQMWCT